ncbi:MAG: sensor histidine kinase [Cyanobacteriota bacterium]
MPPHRPPALRIWLQSSALVAVLAGYGLLLSAGSLLTVRDRQEGHQQLVSAIRRQLGEQPALEPSQIALLQLLGVSVRLEPRRSPQPPQLIRQGSSTWLSSRSSLTRPGLPAASLVVRQDVTATIQRERNLQLLLLAAAGLASLFTSALLRQVMRRGLVLPIQAFCLQLQLISRPAQGAALMPEQEQPSELRPIAAAFNALQQRLAAAWERERSFTDGVAHELRTPITLISGKAQSLLRESLSAAQRHAIEAIASEARHMGSLVRDLLDLARQDAGRLELLCQPLDPDTVILDTFDRLWPLAPDRLQLAPARASAPPLAVRGDRARLMQCLTALVDNALAYAPAGPVELALSQAAGSVVWHVRDRGPGVTPEERERIFERFARGSAAAAAQRRGSGLGLALVRLLMQAMGGSVVAADRPGGGADFQLHLPLAPEAAR